MIISLDNLAHRYGMLPSEALFRGSSYDFKVMAISTSYHNKMREEQDHGAGNKPYVPTIGKEEMIAMMKRAKEIQSAQS